MADQKPRATLNDVAAASGVSRATASFVLRDSPGQSISAATRERVRAAARALGYVPNGLARALREGTLADRPARHRRGPRRQLRAQLHQRP